MDVIGYTRVSTDGQAESGAGLEAQEAAVWTECERRGWHLVRIASDTGSGKTMDGRPAMTEALGDLDGGQADALVAAKLDRVSRSVADFARLMVRASKKGWALVLLDLGVDTTTPNGKFMANVMVSVAELERELIGQRTKDALAARRAAGVTLGRPRTLDPAVRARIVAERAAGRSLRAIAADLSAEAVPTARGGSRWHASSVRQIAEAA